MACLLSGRSLLTMKKWQLLEIYMTPVYGKQ